MTELDETTVRTLLTVAATTPGSAPDPVGAVVRRRRRERTRRALAGTVGLAAGTALVVGVAIGVVRTPFTAADGVGPAVSAEAGVARLGAVAVTVPDGFEAVVTGDACVAPKTVAVLPDAVGIVGGRGGCTDGPWLALSRTAPAGPGWVSASGGGIRSRLVVVGGTAAWETVWGATSSGFTTWKLPAAGVFVTVTGTLAQRSALLAAVSAEPGTVPDTPRKHADTAPGDPAADLPVLNRADLVTATVSGVTASGATATTRDPVLLDRLRSLLVAAPRVDRDRWCVPAAADSVLLDLSASTDGDPETGSRSASTSFVLAVQGACRLAYSSTGAVVEPDPIALAGQLSAIRSDASPAAGG